MDLNLHCLQKFMSHYLGYIRYISNNFVGLFEVLQPSQPSEVMSSIVSLPNDTFTGQA